MAPNLAATLLIAAAAAVGVIVWALVSESTRGSAGGQSTEREPAARPKPEPALNKVLFVLSDGESTDGDPAPKLVALREAGLTVVCCYVGATDIVDNSRRLPTAEIPSWDDGARKLFEYASPVPTGSYRDYLQEKGWHIPDGARLFFQANHSDILTEIAELIMR